MSLLPVVRSPFPGGAPADGSPARPYTTTMAGAAGLAALEAAHTIADGDTVIIDAAGDAVVYRAVVVGGALHWYAPVLGDSFDAVVGIRGADPAASGFTETVPTGGAVDYNTTVSQHVVLMSGASAGQSAFAASTLAQAANTRMAVVLADARVVTVSGSASDAIAGVVLNTTAKGGGGVGIALFGDRADWRVGDTYAGIDVTSSHTIEVSFDADAEHAWIRLNRSAKLHRAAATVSQSFGTAFCTAFCNFADSSQRRLQFKALLAGRIS